ncbi:MAG TPA: flagellar export protein FliJ, partial [Pirellulales bacterium]
AEDILTARIAQLDEEIVFIRQHSKTAGQVGPINVDRLLDAGRYEMALRAERQSASSQRDTVAQEVERRRQALVEADREVKSLEKLRERQLERHRYEESRRESKQLDAIAVQSGFAREEEG